jgi:hypothetical protein
VSETILDFDENYKFYCLGIAITTTTSTTSTSTTATTTTTTALVCGFSCVNYSSISSSNLLAKWSFDGSFLDQTNAYNGIPCSNAPTFVTGYLGQAASFSASFNQCIYTSYIPLYHASFTVDAWINPTGFPNPLDQSIVGLCPSVTVDACLHVNIRTPHLYFGFYNDDLPGTTNIVANQWIHVAYVFDATLRQQTIYLNGFVNAQRTSSGLLQVASGDFTIGTNQYEAAPLNFFQVSE